MRRTTGGALYHSGATRAAFHWNPQTETWLALSSVAAMFLVYRTSSALAAEHPAVGEAAFTLFGIMGVATLLPIALVRRGGGSLGSLGVTRQRLTVSLAVSGVFALGSLPAYFTSAGAGASAFAHLAASLLNLWEPLFVYGWLQMRLEHAFGWLPAPLIGALCFAGYHIGSVPPAALGPLVFWGAIIGAIFAATRNLFAVFPLAWGVASAMGSTSAPLTGWSAVMLAAGLVALQAIVLRLLLPPHESPNKRLQRRRKLYATKRGARSAAEAQRR